jgi:AcrR family transcriptional regulator
MAIKRADAAARSATTTKRPGVYSRGSETVDAILKAALHVLIEEGASAFTLRRIAQQCGLNVGNVSRHFPRKEMLVQVLLEDLLSPSEGLIERNIRETGMSPEDALALVIGGSLDQIESKSMTHLFIELWAMANHNEFVAERVEGVYRYVHRLIASFVAQLNPALSQEDVDAVSLFINASIEGSTMLAGFGKPWSPMMPQMKAIAVRSLVQLAKTITPDEIRALPAPGAKPKPARRPRAASGGEQLAKQHS